MTIFEFYWSDYEEYQPYLLEHNNKTKEGFIIDCKLALRKVGNEYLESESSWASACDWIDVAVEYMVNNMGYKKIKPISFGHFGSSIIKGNNESDENWKKLVGSELYEKAIKHNLSLNKELFGRDSIL